MEKEQPATGKSYPGFAELVWAFLPAILFSLSPLAGYHKGDVGVVPEGVGDWIIGAGFWGGPFLLFPIALRMLKGTSEGRSNVVRSLRAAVLVMVLMMANVFIGIAGCGAVARRIPPSPRVYPPHR